MLASRGWPIAAILLSLLLIPHPGQAEWTADGTPVVALPGFQTSSSAIADGSGGVFIAWQDDRGANTDIYAQRLDRFGNALWTTDGVLVCGATGSQTKPHIASDGAGGVIVSWDDLRTIDSHIYTQRLDATGAPLWTTDGHPVCTATGYHTGNAILADGAGGAFIAWNFGAGGSTDIYMQRVDSDGNDQWAANGVVVAAEANYQLNPRLVSDDAGGAIVVWGDNRNGTWYAYAGHVNSNGTQVWMPNGVILNSNAGGTQPPVINLDRDGTGGVVVGFRTSGSWVQRVSANGIPQWSNNDASYYFSARAPAVVGDGAGGAFIAWEGGLPPDPDILAQHLNAAGSRVWAPFIAVAVEVNSQSTPLACLNPDGSLIITWNDTRNGSNPQLYAQRVDAATGLVAWTSGGVPVTSTATARTVTALLAPSEMGVLAVWDDGDVYAQRLHSLTGDYGAPDGFITSVTDVPNDNGGFVQVDWDASDRDNIPQHLISHYSVWRATDFVPAGSPLRALAEDGATVVASRGEISDGFTGNARHVQTTAQGTYYWEWVGNTSALQWASYNDVVPTRRDATGGDPALHYFQVLAHTTDPFVFWESDVVTGSSTDDLAPAAPLMLSATRDGNDVNLQWSPSGMNEPDFKEYALYRTATPGVVTDPGNLVGTATGTALTDTSVPLSALYYVAVARDVHGNESTPSNEATIATPTGADTPAITSLQVRANVPNPFTTTTSFSVGLPQRAAASVDVFDVAGRRVATRRGVALDAGWNTLHFDGRDDRGRPLPSGVYFWRVTADGETRVRKIVVQR